MENKNLEDIIKTKEQMISFQRQENDILSKTIKICNRTDEANQKALKIYQEIIDELKRENNCLKEINQTDHETIEINNLTINKYKRAFDIQKQILEIYKEKNQNLKNIIYNMVSRIQEQILSTWGA